MSKLRRMAEKRFQVRLLYLRTKPSSLRFSDLEYGLSRRSVHLYNDRRNNSSLPSWALFIRNLGSACVQKGWGWQGI